MAPGAALLAGKALKFLPYITGTLGGIQGFDKVVLEEE